MFTVTSSAYGVAKNETSSRGTSTAPRARAASHSSYSPATAVNDSGVRSCVLSELRICSGRWRTYIESAARSTCERRNISEAG